MNRKLLTSPVELHQIAEWLQAAGLYSIEISGPDGLVRVVASVGGGKIPATRVVQHESASRLHVAQINSPDVGVFRLVHPLRTMPFVQDGDAVRASDIVGLLGTRGLYHPIVAPCAGRVVRMHAEDRQPVGYGARLLDLEISSP